MSTNETSIDEVAIACNLDAIPLDVREEWSKTVKEVYASVQEIQALPDGYGFRLPAESAMLLKVAEYIANERLCCPFLHFTVEIEPHGGPCWLRLTGDAGVKEYIWSLFGTSNLLDERLIKAARG